jgi:hypothetical protein
MFRLRRLRLRLQLSCMPCCGGYSLLGLLHELARRLVLLPVVADFLQAGELVVVLKLAESWQPRQLNRDGA